jgi:GrpB-like predicted nucleotidyltransferase (UPF0157 family)
MPSRAEIVSFDDSPPPRGADPRVPGAAPATGIEVADPDPAWPRQYDHLAGRIRQAMGWRALQLEHVGSTSVPALAAKPVIDIDLTVADPDREQDYVPALETIGFRLVIREPWWLRATGETVGHPEPGTLAGLTPQERRIVTAVSEGATNRKVAAALFLSPRTVDYHLRKVFRKTGVTSRAELIKLSLTEYDQ